MSGLVAIVAAISTAVVAELAATDMPSLTDGGILLGGEHLHAMSAPPRIVFVPSKTPLSAAKDIFADEAMTVGQLNGEQAWAQRAIAGRKTGFEVHVWGAAATPEPRADFTATELLYECVIRNVQALFAGNFELLDGDWPDQHDTATQLAKLGHSFVFGIRFGTPIPDLPLTYAPADVSPETSVTYQPAEGVDPEEP